MRPRPCRSPPGRPWTQRGPRPPRRRRAPQRPWRPWGRTGAAGGPRRPRRGPAAARAGDAAGARCSSLRAPHLRAHVSTPPGVAPSAQLAARGRTQRAACGAPAGQAAAASVGRERNFKRERGPKRSPPHRCRRTCYVGVQPWRSEAGRCAPERPPKFGPLRAKFVRVAPNPVDRPIWAKSGRKPADFRAISTDMGQILLGLRRTLGQFRPMSCRTRSTLVYFAQNAPEIARNRPNSVRLRPIWPVDQVWAGAGQTCTDSTNLWPKSTNMLAHVDLGYVWGTSSKEVPLSVDLGVAPPQATSQAL